MGNRLWLQKQDWYHIIYTVILLREAYLIRLVTNSGRYFNKDIIKYQFTAVFKPKIFNKKPNDLSLFKNPVIILFIIIGRLTGGGLFPALRY